MPAEPELPTGAAMDRALPAVHPLRRRWPWVAGAAAFGAVLLPALFALREQLSAQHRAPSPPAAVAAPALDATGTLALRAVVEPLRSVQIDAPESGLVQAVLVRDGDTVAAGAPLVRFHSPEHEQLLLQRAAEVAQQMANASSQRSAQVVAQAQNRRERAQLETDLQQAESEAARQRALAAAGFVAPAAVEQAGRREQLARRLLAEAVEDQAADAAVRAQSLAQMEQAVQRLQQGLALLERSRERLLQRAPIAGRLSGLTLQVGAAVRAGDHIARIDDPEGGVQLVAEVDEYFLPRLAPGLAATSAHGPLVLVQTLPQVRGGRVKAWLRWADGAAPGLLRPGQAVDLRLRLEPLASLSPPP